MLQFGCDPDKFYEEHSELLGKRTGNTHMGNTETKCICGNRATVVGPGGFEICRSCDWKIVNREWDAPTLQILHNAGYKVFRYHWLSGGYTDSYGTDRASAFNLLGGGGLIRAVDYYEEITEDMLK